MQSAASWLGLLHVACRTVSPLSLYMSYACLQVAALQLLDVVDPDLALMPLVAGHAQAQRRESVVLEEPRVCGTAAGVAVNMQWQAPLLQTKQVSLCAFC